jgi:flagellar L-ring protein precursor FlgH
MIRMITLAVATIVLVAAAVLSQQPANATPVANAAPGATTAPVVAATNPATPAAATAGAPNASAAVPALGTRASWLSDRRPLHVGDIITVTIEESTSASEQTSVNASANRGFDGTLNVNTSGPASAIVGPAKEFATGVKNGSQDENDASRQGNLSSTLAAKITAIDGMGNAQIEGSKFVQIDGRQQEIKLAGLIRADDVTYDDQVSSTRIANATISYKGKTIKPKTGIIGKIVGLIWP